LILNGLKEKIVSLHYFSTHIQEMHPLYADKYYSKNKYAIFLGGIGAERRAYVFIVKAAGWLRDVFA
jgi:hypothetical protein